MDSDCGNRMQRRARPAVVAVVHFFCAPVQRSARPVQRAVLSARCAALLTNTTHLQVTSSSSSSVLPIPNCTDVVFSTSIELS